MNIKMIWKRKNRGFIVSMALLALVLIYVLATQLMMIPEKQKIKALADEYRGLMESTSQLTDEQTAALKDDTALKTERNRLSTELSSYFVKDAGYLDTAVGYLVNNISTQTSGAENVTFRSKPSLEKQTVNIDQDIAACSLYYTYTVSGEFMNYTTNKLETVTSVKQELYLAVDCKKVDGVWKLYRVSEASWRVADKSGSYGGANNE